jgi:chromosome segregation ATPase
LKRRFRLLQLQIQQLKEEITEKEKMLSTVKLEVNQKSKELNREIACARNQAQTLATQKNKIQELYNYMDKMKKMIAENQLENDRLKKENEQVMNERD